MKKLLLAAACVTLLLAACGGHDHDDMPATSAPPVATTPPPAADPNADVFEAQVAMVVASGPDDAEPAALDASAPTMPDNTEPLAVK